MKTIVLICLLPISVAFAGEPTKASIEDLSHVFRYAMEERNFHEARHILHQMIPLMKKDIKNDKKLISKAMKTDCANNEDIGALERDLMAKSEVFHFAEHLLHTSNAALRARCKDMVLKMESYIAALL